MNDIFFVISWPEVEPLMPIEGFKDNCFPITCKQGVDQFGPISYFVRKKWYTTVIDKRTSRVIDLLNKYLEEEQPNSYSRSHALLWLSKYDRLPLNEHQVFFVLLASQFDAN